MAGAERLGVWLGDVRIAQLEQPRWPQIRLRYTSEALDRWPRNSPVVSCSLPLSPRPQDAANYCRGLLPEGQALQALAAAAGLAVNDTFALLRRYGRDVAGALVISAEPPAVDRHTAIPYTDEALADAVDDLKEHPLGVDDDSELSLAGLQDKLLLVRVGRTWARPLHGRPSTHILKVDDLRYPGLVTAEAHCLALAHAAGLSDLSPTLARVGAHDCLIVTRFDRVAEPDGAVRRIHQEDLCQALNIDHEARRGRGKYEDAGGPSFAQAARLLDAYARDPVRQLDRLVAVAAFTVLIGNADAHGKNLALLHREPEHVELAPLYDTVPTMLWPRLRTQAAMLVGGRADLAAITRDDLLAEADSWGHARERAEAAIDETVGSVRAALDRGVGPGGRLAELIGERAARLAR